MGALLKLKKQTSDSRSTLAKSVKNDVAKKKTVLNFQTISQQELEKERISAYPYLL